MLESVPPLSAAIHSIRATAGRMGGIVEAAMPGVVDQMLQCEAGPSAREHRADGIGKTREPANYRITISGKRRVWSVFIT